MTCQCPHCGEKLTEEFILREAARISGRRSYKKMESRRCPIHGIFRDENGECPRCKENLPTKKLWLGLIRLPEAEIEAFEAAAIRSGAKSKAAWVKIALIDAALETEKAPYAREELRAGKRDKPWMNYRFTEREIAILDHAVASSGGTKTEWVHGVLQAAANTS